MRRLTIVAVLALAGCAHEPRWVQHNGHGWRELRHFGPRFDVSRDTLWITPDKGCRYYYAEPGKEG